MSETELWRQGEIARGTCQEPLIGRADVMAGDVRRQALQIRPDEPPRNRAKVAMITFVSTACKRYVQPLERAARPVGPIRLVVYLLATRQTYPPQEIRSRLSQSANVGNAGNANQSNT